MKVSELLAEAWAEVEAANLPEDIRREAFREAVRLLAFDGQTRGLGGGNITPQPEVKEPVKAPPKAAAPRRSSRPATPPPDGGIDEASFYSKVAEESGVSQDQLERVFHVVDGQIQISLSRSKLGTTVRARMASVAQLLSTARQFALGEDATSTKVIREECRRLNTLDRNNFNTTVSNLEGYAYIGPTADKRLKVRPVAEQAFPSVVARVLGETASED